MAKKFTDADIPNLNEDWGSSSTDNTPYSGKSVQKFIKDKLRSRGTRLNLVKGREDENKYSVVLLGENEEGEEVELSRTPEFSIGDTSTLTNVVLRRVSEENPLLKVGDSAEFTFFYDHADGNGASTGLGATATVTVTSGSIKNSYVLNLTPGRNYTINPSQYFKEGTNNITVSVTTNDPDNPQTARVQWTAIVTNLVLSSEFDITNGGKPIVRGESITLDFGIAGSGNVVTKLFIDGVLSDTRAGVTQAGGFTINTNTLTAGLHTFQLISELDSSGSVLRSNSILFLIPIVGEENLKPAIAARFDYPDGAVFDGKNAALYVDQYSEFSVNYTVFKPVKGGDGRITADYAVAEVYAGTTIISQSELNDSVSKISHKFSDVGTYEGHIYAIDKADGSNYTTFDFAIVVAKAAFSIEEPTGNVELNLDAIGKTNSSADKDSWTYENVRSTFTNVSFADGNDGWSTSEDSQNALTLASGGSVEIGYKPFDINNAVNENYTFVVKFKADTVTNDDGVLIDCTNGSGYGLAITSQEVRITTNTNRSIVRKFAYGSTYEIAIVSNARATDSSAAYVRRHSGMLYVYINGELGGAIQKADAESIFHYGASNIKITGTDARVSVYNIRAYRRALTPDEVLNLYMVDLGDNTLTLAKYEENDIADENGVVTIDKVKERGTVPYMIITGNTNNVSTVLYAAAVNDKKPKYDLWQNASTPGEILYVNPEVPASNFKLVGGCIRLQGTSSLAYPIKNYRIYFKNANKEAGELYLGCDEFGEGGTLQDKPVYALRGYSGETPSIPVDCFCLKADYAESSSSHNTGFAVLINNALKTSGEYTPAQKYKSSSYKYDVRTTVDGFPMYLFYRNTASDTPTFLGKFNFNNDKSTEAVFGFLDIPGYHVDEEGNPSAWIAEKFNGANPTECWEFKNNSNPMGGFHFDSRSPYNGKKNYTFDTYTTSTDKDGKTTTTYDWLDCWEARFPDEDKINALYESGEKKPKYLETVAKWISDTDTSVAGLTSAEISSRRNRFRNELRNYFDVDYLCDYYISTVIVAAVDQQIKNMMLGFWYNPDAEDNNVMGKVRGYFIFYDNDTILGVRNDGELKYKWDVDENTVDPQTNNYAYAGARSTLWVNLRSEFANEIRAAYNRLRDETPGKISYDSMNTAFTVNQTAKFPERMYNIDAVNKYISPLTEGVLNTEGKMQTYSYLSSLQGSRKYHRDWWIKNRLDMLDATYLGGTYKGTQIEFKGDSGDGLKEGETLDASAAQHTITVVPGRDWYFALESDVAGTASKTDFVRAGDTWQYTYSGGFQVGSIWHLYGVKFAKKIDLSLFAPFLSDITLNVLPYLEELVLGSFNTVFREYTTENINIADNLPLLKVIKLQNYSEMNTIDVSQCSQLEEFDCSGCTNMTNVLLPSTSNLKRGVYGSGIQTITLVNKTEVENLTAEGLDNIVNITMRNCNNTCVDFVFDILTAKFA